MRAALLLPLLAVLMIAAQGRHLSQAEAPDLAPTPGPGPAPSAAAGTPPPLVSSGPTGFTAAEVALHNTAADAWLIINGKVYDLTDWVPQHPGGAEQISMRAGTDASADFSAQHGGNPYQASILEGYYLGELVG